MDDKQKILTKIGGAAIGVLIFMFVIWAGLKFILGFIVGIATIVFVFKTKNPLFMKFIER